MESKLDKERRRDRKKLMARESGQVNVCRFQRGSKIIAAKAPDQLSGREVGMGRCETV